MVSLVAWMAGLIPGLSASAWWLLFLFCFKGTLQSNPNSVSPLSHRGNRYGIPNAQVTASAEAQHIKETYPNAEDKARRETSQKNETIALVRLNSACKHSRCLPLAVHIRHM